MPRLPLRRDVPRRLCRAAGAGRRSPGPRSILSARARQDGRSRVGVSRAARFAEDRKRLYNGRRTRLDREAALVKTSLVIQALNEADVIGPLLSRIPHGIVDEVVVVD